MTRASLRQTLDDIARMDAKSRTGALLSELLTTTAGDVAFVMELVATRDGPAVARYAARSRDPARAHEVERWVESARGEDWPDFTRPGPRSQRGFVALDRSSDPAEPNLLRAPRFPPRYGRLLRNLVFDERELVAWVGVVREGSRPFSRRVVEHWRTVSDDVGRILGCGSVRASGPGGQLLLRRDGTVKAASVGGRAWLEATDAETALRITMRSSAIRETRTVAVCGATVDVTPACDDEDLLFATVRTNARLRLAPDSRLTPTQREVAAYAAAGATAPEIATTLDAAVDTVRTHLREIYRRLDVASRVELAQLLRG